MHKPKIILKCLQCGHEWEQRTGKLPACCPACRSRRWNKDNHPAPELIGGGRQIFYLRNHKTEVAGYLRAKGLAETLKHYNISQPTLERLIAGDYGEPSKLTTPERAIRMAEIALTSNAELRREIREMREEYSHLVQLIAGQITGKIVEALQSIQIQLPPSLDYGGNEQHILLLPSKKELAVFKTETLGVPNPI